MNRADAEAIIRREHPKNALVPMLDEMAGNRGFEATEGGHLLALLEEEADWQLTIYQHSASEEGADKLHEKIEALEYAVGLLKTCKLLVEAGCKPVFIPEEMSQ